MLWPKTSCSIQKSPMYARGRRFEDIRAVAPLLLQRMAAAKKRFNCPEWQTLLSSLETKPKQVIYIVGYW